MIPILATTPKSYTYYMKIKAFFFTIVSQTTMPLHTPFSAQSGINYKTLNEQ